MIDMSGMVIQIRPRQSVPTNTKKSIPVGIEINSVVNINGAFSNGAQPEMYIW